ncbi:hypothetical protein DL96DRAFT_1163753 [Flagelloscypha sp. PMI_526]|nr:hypothetical protein DL96DRAFT_1163753 [Flagelloscypha sp. PMI_526]
MIKKKTLCKTFLRFIADFKLFSRRQLHRHNSSSLSNLSVLASSTLPPQLFLLLYEHVAQPECRLPQLPLDRLHTVCLSVLPSSHQQRLFSNNRPSAHLFLRTLCRCLIVSTFSRRIGADAKSRSALQSQCISSQLFTKLCSIKTFATYFGTVRTPFYSCSSPPASFKFISSWLISELSAQSQPIPRIPEPQHAEDVIMLGPEPQQAQDTLTEALMKETSLYNPSA